MKPTDSDMTKNEFKIGDRVSVEDSKCSGIVTAVDGMRCLVRFDSGRVVNFPKMVLQHRASHIPKDRKTAFLTELQELLRKYDAVIDIAADYGYSVGLSLRINEEEVIHNREVTELHADNIMDFNKE